MMDYLDVAIGLLVFYTLMSMIASALVEYWTSKKRLRGEILKKAVGRFCCGFDRAVDQIYGAPEIRSLVETDANQNFTCLPSEIPPEIFVRVATRVIFSGGIKEKVNGYDAIHPEKILDLEMQFEQAASQWAINLDNEISKDAPDSKEIEASKTAPDSKEKEASKTAPDSKEIEASKTAPDSKEKEAFQKLEGYIRGVVIQAGNDVGLFERLLLQHFNDVIKRASGWYRRRITLCLLRTGFVMAILLNADSIMMLQRLVVSEELRRDAVTLAIELQKADAASRQTANSTNDGAASVSGSGDKSGEVQVTSANHNAASKQQVTTLQDPKQLELTGMLAEIEAMSGGITGLVKQGEVAWKKGILCFIFFLLIKGVGFFLTAIAISLGSKFWFDLLSKVVSLRNSLTSSKLAELAPAVVAGDSLRLPEIGMVGEPYRARPRASAEQLKQMLQAARISAAAYQEAGSVCTAIGGNLSYTFIKAFDYRPKTLMSDTQCFLLWEDKSKRLIVVFRGSEKNLGDWATNAKVNLVPFQANGLSFIDEGQILVHQGFQEALTGVWGSLVEELKKECGKRKNESIDLDFCGHSLGGALAVLAAVRLILEQGNATNSEVIKNLKFHRLLTIGQPRVGNEGFCQLVDSLISDSYTRAVNDADIVPHVPLVSMGYQHTGTLHYFTRGGTLLVNPSNFAVGFDQITAIEQAKLTIRRNQLIECHEAEKYIRLYEGPASGF